MSPLSPSLLTAEASAEYLGVSLPSLWRAVAAGRLPAPVYPAARAPRWRRDELDAALEATRAKPSQAMAARRAARLAAERDQAA
jgi:predicted DNA-binding transcriptional regulator AlpA